MMKKVILQHYRIILLFTFICMMIVTAWNCDDAYHGYAMAKNLAHGNGFVYNVGERVNASTCPLFDIILGLIGIVTGHISAVGMLVCVIYSTGAYLIVTKYFCKEKWQFGFVTLAMLISPCFLAYTTSGLENSLLFLLEGIYLLIYTSNERFSAMHLFLLALTCSGILLTRLDAGLVFFFSTAFVFIVKKECSWVRMIVSGICGLIPFMAWEAFSVFYYGAIFPNTYYIKVNTGFPVLEYIQSGVAYILITLGFDAAVISFTIIGCLIMMICKDWKIRILGLGLALKILYLIRVGGDFMVGRHFTDLYFLSISMLMYISTQRPGLEMKKTLCGVLFCCGAFTIACRPFMYNFMWGSNQGKVADEQRHYYPTLGLMPRVFSLLKTGEDTQFRTWIEDGITASIEAGYSGDMFGFAPGVCAYRFNEEIYMTDGHGLGDPLLSKLPAVYTGPTWRIGHMYREIPDGYKESLVTDSNLIADPSLHEMYDVILMVTRGELWDKDRINTAVRYAFGHYDYLIDEYLHNKEAAKTEYTFYPYSKDSSYEGQYENGSVVFTGSEKEDEPLIWGYVPGMATGIYDVTVEYEYINAQSGTDITRVDLYDDNGGVAPHLPVGETKYTIEDVNYSLDNKLVRLYVAQGDSIRIHRIIFKQQGNI